MKVLGHVEDLILRIRGMFDNKMEGFEFFWGIVFAADSSGVHSEKEIVLRDYYPVEVSDEHHAVGLAMSLTALVECF